jgi:hypothetical protein
MAADVNAVQQTVDTERNGVRHLEHAVAKCAHERAIWLEHDDRVIAAARAITAIDDVHAIVRSGRNAGHVTHGPVVREVQPVVDFSVGTSIGTLELHAAHCTGYQFVYELSRRCRCGASQN